MKRYLIAIFLGANLCAMSSLEKEITEFREYSLEKMQHVGTDPSTNVLFSIQKESCEKDTSLYFVDSQDGVLRRSLLEKNKTSHKHGLFKRGMWLPASKVVSGKKYSTYSLYYSDSGRYALGLCTSFPLSAENRPQAVAIKLFSHESQEESNKVKHSIQQRFWNVSGWVNNEGSLGLLLINGYDNACVAVYSCANNALVFKQAISLPSKNIFDPVRSKFLVNSYATRMVCVDNETKISLIDLDKGESHTISCDQNVCSFDKIKDVQFIASAHKDRRELLVYIVQKFFYDRPYLKVYDLENESLLLNYKLPRKVNCLRFSKDEAHFVLFCDVVSSNQGYPLIIIKNPFAQRSSGMKFLMYASMKQKAFTDVICE